MSYFQLCHVGHNIIQDIRAGFDEIHHELRMVSLELTPETAPPVISADEVQDYGEELDPALLVVEEPSETKFSGVGKRGL